MKKIICVILSAFMLLAFCGCTYSKPDEDAKIFFDGIKSRDLTVIAKYCETNKAMNMLLNSKGDKEDNIRLYKKLFKNFSYKIVSTKKEDNKATIEVEITNTDMKKVFKRYSSHSYKYVLNNVYNNLTKAKIKKACVRVFEEQLDATIKKKEKVTNKVTIELKANDENHNWDVQLDDKLMDAMLGGLMSAYKK